MKLNPLTLAGILVGAGMGGFFDGIAFHQIFQLHNMLSNQVALDTVANAERNMFWDGLFHAVMWVFTAAGITLTWNAVKKGEDLHTDWYVGSIALGWGLFNLIEGIIDHHVLQIHHVVQDAVGSDQVFWDVLFLASGVFLIMVGVYMRRQSSLASARNYDRLTPVLV